MERPNQNYENLDLATVKDLAKFFRIDRASVSDVMTNIDVPRRGAGYAWLRIWLALGVNVSTAKDHEALKIRLLELKDVAALLGESPKTTRRRGDGEHKDKSIPAHIDLGPRKRLYFPAEIQFWLLGEPVPFERKQEKLSFIPAKQKKSSPPKKSRKEDSIALPSQVSAATLFMAPP